MRVLTVEKLREKLADAPADWIVQVRAHIGENGQPKSTTLQIRDTEDSGAFTARDLWVWLGYEYREEQP